MYIIYNYILYIIIYYICILINSILSYIYSISSFLGSFCWDKFCANIQSFTSGPCLDKNCLCSSCTALGDGNPNHSNQTLKKSVMVALSDMIRYDQWAASHSKCMHHCESPIYTSEDPGSAIYIIYQMLEIQRLWHRDHRDHREGSYKICCADQMELGGNCRRVTSVSAWEATQKGRSWKKCNI